MAGVKGRSGRQKAPFQLKRQKVIDLAWDTMFDALSDQSLPLSQRAELAKGIVVKNIPQELDHKGEIKYTAEEVIKARQRLFGITN